MNKARQPSTMLHPPPTPTQPTHNTTKNWCMSCATFCQNSRSVVRLASTSSTRCTPFPSLEFHVRRNIKNIRLINHAFPTSIVMLQILTYAQLAHKAIECGCSHTTVEDRRENPRLELTSVYVCDPRSGAHCSLLTTSVAHYLCCSLPLLLTISVPRYLSCSLLTT